MRFRSIAVAGLGLMGGSLIKAVKKVYPEITAGAWDMDVVLDKAADEGVIDIKYDSLMDLLEADLIFLALPVDKSVAAFEQLIPELKEGQVISDLCSVKTVFKNLWEEKGKRGRYIGGHPMAGKEVGGYEASEADIFRDTVFIVTEDREKDAIDYTSLIRNIGCRPLFLEAEEHDRVVAGVSHLPQLMATALLNTTEEKSTAFVGKGFIDMTRIAGSSFDMWKSVLHSNSKEVIKAIDSVVDELNMMKDALYHGEYRKLEMSFCKSENIRNSMST